MIKACGIMGCLFRPTTLSSGEGCSLTVVGDTCWKQIQDRFLNLNIFTKNGTEIEYDSLRVDSSSLPELLVNQPMPHCSVKSCGGLSW